MRYIKTGHASRSYALNQVMDCLIASIKVGGKFCLCHLIHWILNGLNYNIWRTWWCILNDLNELRQSLFYHYKFKFYKLMLEISFGPSQFPFDFITMKLFQCTQKFFRMLGLHPPQHCQNSSFNLKNILIILLLVIGFLDAIAFLLFQAKSVKEFGDSFYVSATEWGTLVYFSIHVRKMTNVSNLIERFGGLVQKSKFQCFWFYAWDSLRSVFGSNPWN